MRQVTETQCGAHVGAHVGVPWPSQGLGEEISTLVLGTYGLKHNQASFDVVADGMVPDIDML